MGDVVRRLDVDWDDPETPELEVAPAQAGTLRALDAANGVAWASGYGLLMRITPGLDGRLRAKGYWLQRTLPENEAQNRQTPGLWRDQGELRR